MIRTITVDKTSTLAELISTVVSARARDSQAEATLTRFKELNPHVDPDRLSAGTVLILPDLTGLKASAGEAAARAPLTHLKTLFESALGQAADNFGARVEARSATRSQMAKGLKSAAFKKILNESDQPNTLARDTGQSLAEEEKKERDAQERFVRVSEAALQALARLDKIVG
jgi:hypothetical protein